MKSINVFAAVLIFVSGVATGIAVSNSPGAAALAQEKAVERPLAEAPLPVPPKPLERGEVGRYQIAAFGSTSSTWGCFRLDTQTGDTWYSSQGGKFRRVSN
jgi:hypothetical protein